MTDTYQAVYDAVRSKISNGDIGHAIESVARHAFDIGHTRAILQQDFCIAASEMQRPCVLFRPKVYPDGDKWCALYGDDIQSGVAGFGDTPSAACADFDNWWWKGCPR